MKNGCGCNECTCSTDTGTLDFLEHPWSIPEIMKVVCYCVACEEECDACECSACSCSDEVEHLGAGT